MQTSASLEQQVRALTDRLASVETRLAALEAREGWQPPAGEAGDATEVQAPFTAPPFDARGWTTALGRSLIVLGGAFLLRALTDAGVWPPVVGVTLGLLYAGIWLVTSDRAAARGLRVRAFFDGATALVIVFPLLVEATMRFRLLGGDSAALALGAFSSITLVAAWRADLRALGWMATLGGMMTGLTLMVRTGTVAPYSLYFTGLGAGTLWLSYLRLWRGLRWPTGLLAVAGVLGVTSRAASSPPADAASTAWLAQVALVVAYFASIAIRTLVRGRQILVFEVVQTALVLAASIGGAFAVTRAQGEGTLVLGLALVAFGVAAYLVSFPFLPRESRGALNFYFYSTLALALVLIGLQTALGGAPRAMAFTGLSVLLAVAWWRSGRVSLGGHTAVALTAAAVAGGLLTLAGGAFTGEMPDASVPALLTLVVATLVSAAPVGRADAPRPRGADLPALVVALVSAGGLAGALTLAASGAAGALGMRVSDAGVLATIRTSVLAALAVACAIVDRPGALSAVGKLAYPLLAATGLKLALVDLRYSTPATLFVALACYGAALVLVPRLRGGAITVEAL